MAVKVTSRTQEIVEPFLLEKGLRVYDITYGKEAADKILRLYIDKKDGLVSIDECEEVSRWLSDRLDEEDFINEAYVLEVSSPGIERQLKYDWHFKEAEGKKVLVRLFNKVNNLKSYVGEIVSGTEKGDVTISANGEEITFKRENIIDVKIYFEFGGN